MVEHLKRYGSSRMLENELRSDSKPVEDRRAFFGRVGGLLGAAWAGLAGCLTVAFVTTPLRQRSGSQEIGLGPVVAFDDGVTRKNVTVSVSDGWRRREEHRTLYVTRNGAGELAVLSGTCTHLGCTVNWNMDDREFQCPCHGGRFQSSGAVVAGPPPAPLEAVASEVRDGTLFVRLA